MASNVMKNNRRQDSAILGGLIYIQTLRYYRSYLVAYQFSYFSLVKPKLGLVSESDFSKAIMFRNTQLDSINELADQLAKY